ncbi:TPA: hypothetical protein ACPI87_000188 [Haemophilus influenzae]|uniref:Uncharacterized protein n=1 Tax=Haemophilus influenzae 22.4-21 TaxID=375063 RepID=A4P078_HAEIF|nr:hypothetical protein [Haemophilus influenzae]EDK13186.1 hypothetical protein CGSHiR3021_02638 [Haemophilus influenzae 22.4-21]VEI53857.1 Uncharacterised protein [Haemophilus influenzae]
MIDIEKEYQELETERKNKFISLYDLIVFIRKHNPNSSDNKIATVLLKKFKDYQDKFNSLYFESSLTDLELSEQECKILELGGLMPLELSSKLHEPEMPLSFGDLIEMLEAVEKNGINERVPF